MDGMKGLFQSKTMKANYLNVRYGAEVANRKMQKFGMRYSGTIDMLMLSNTLYVGQSSYFTKIR